MGALDKEIAGAAEHGMYMPANEKDACGVGFVAHVKGAKSHAIVQNGLKILENLDLAAQWARMSFAAMARAF
jgi:glutamate synthase (NADPH) large chain